MAKILSQKFFARPAETVAKELLGKHLVRRWRGKRLVYQIRETEGYVGEHDKASHASRGRTPRTEVLYGNPGVFYVYLVYGMYHMLNVVTDTDGYPGAVLIRGCRRVNQKETQKSYSNVRTNIRIANSAVLDGPGKLTRELHIGKHFNNKPAISDTGLWFEDRGGSSKKNTIIATPRIGVDYAGEWAKEPLRFVLKGITERKT